MNVEISSKVENYVFVTPGFAFDLPLRHLVAMFYNAWAALLTFFFALTT